MFFIVTRIVGRVIKNPVGVALLIDSHTWNSSLQILSQNEA